MLRSMTAYGRHELETEAGTLVWELRSVNHRYLELGFRLPERLRSIEPAARELLGKRLKRGKVDASLRFTPSSSHDVELSVNRPLANALVTEATQLATTIGQSASVDTLRILSWPGVVSEKQGVDDALHASALEGLKKSLEDYLGMREREGTKIEGMLRERCDAIEAIVVQLREIRPAVVERQQAKLRQRISDQGIEADAGRLEMELVLQAQKLDVDEELDRLGAHIGELRAILERNEPVGRRLDFLIQEFNREANTLGSKAADSDSTNCTVELKVLIEQMREQVQNLE